MKSQNYGAILLQIALLLMSQPCNQNQSIAPELHTYLFEAGLGPLCYRFEVSGESLSTSRTPQLASKIGSSNQSLHSQKSSPRKIFLALSWCDCLHFSSRKLTIENATISSFRPVAALRHYLGTSSQKSVLHSFYTVNRGASRRLCT